MNLEKDQVQALLAHWQSTLNLESWRVEFREKKQLKIPKALMEVVPTRERRIAIITVRTDVMDYSIEKFEPLLVHELVHLIYDPLAEEHGDQIRFVDNEGLRGAEYKQRFLKLLERAVEHTATVLTPLGAMGQAIKETTEEMSFYDELTRLSNQYGNPFSSMDACLSLICTRFDQCVGGIWRFHQKTGQIKPIGVWHIGDKVFEDFADNDIWFEPGQTMAGLVYEEGQLAFQLNIDKPEANFNRSRLAKRLGLKTAVMFPIVMSGEKYGLLECVSTSAEPPDAIFLDTVQHACSVIGRLIERYNYQEEILSQLQRFETLAQTAAVPIAVWDEFGDNTFANTAMSKLTGFSRAELVGMNIVDMAPVGGKVLARARFKEMISKEIHESEDLLVATVVLVSKNGTIQVVGVRWSRFQTEEGKFLTVVYHTLNPGDEKVQFLRNIRELKAA